MIMYYKRGQRVKFIIVQTYQHQVDSDKTLTLRLVRFETKETTATKEKSPLV